MVRAPVTALSVGTNIRAHMKRLHYSQAQIATVIGTTQTGVSRRLRGKTTFNVEELALLAALFRVPANRLLNTPPKPTHHNHTETDPA